MLISSNIFFFMFLDS